MTDRVLHNDISLVRSHTSDTLPETVPAIHRLHREAFEQFVLAQAEPWHREHLTTLYAAWHRYNACYFTTV